VLVRLAGVVLAAGLATAQAQTAPRPSANAPAPATGDQPTNRLGRPFPAPVQPPPPAEAPSVHVGVVSPSESRFSKRLRGNRSRMGSGNRTNPTDAAGGMR
jgi:hypothetical protein